MTSAAVTPTCKRNFHLQVGACCRDHSCHDPEEDDMSSEDKSLKLQLLKLNVRGFWDTPMYKGGDYQTLFFPEPLQRFLLAVAAAAVISAAVTSAASRPKLPLAFQSPTWDSRPWPPPASKSHLRLERPVVTLLP